jgi:protein-S-isoprenylcysteine O-methyltransferase Ste14
MTLFPSLQLGWFNGWIPIFLFYAVFIFLLKVFPKETVDRLYDTSGWTQRQKNLAGIGLPFALAGLILTLFTPLKIQAPVFWVGLVLYLVGFSGFISAIHTFNKTPLDEPVTDGLYKISRNPQWVSFAVTLFGAGVMVGSWTILGLYILRVILNHFRILGEERALESQYGESYLNYKESVPRYFLLF